MPRYGRKKIIRTISKDHTQVCFKPCGIKGMYLDRIGLDTDEMEAIRLSDFEGLYQEECANRMGISRTTFSRILTTAHRKIADALLHGKAIVMSKENESKEDK